MDIKNIGVFAIIGALIIATFFINQEEDDKSNHYYIFKMDGESEHWELDGYTVELVPTHQTAGNGTLHYTGEKGDTTTEFNFRTLAVIDGVEMTLQGVSKNWNEPTTINDTTTGSAEASLFMPNGDPVLFKDIEKIYAVIQWKNSDGQFIEERIDLYNRKQ